MKNNVGFGIERRQVFSLPAGQAGQQSSVGKEKWTELAFITGNGSTTETQSYSFVNNNLEVGKYQYRLKQIDFDGTYEFSNEIEVEIGIPERFTLFQNYPNPFNPSTKIKFSIPYVGTRLALSVSLKVYDILGNEVATLVDEYRPAVSYEVEFDASGLTSGVYYYKLKTDFFTGVKKLMLIK